MQCYYRSEYGRNGYRKRLHAWCQMLRRKEACFCNKDEYANYERGHDHTLKKMRNVLTKETRERLPPLRGIEKHRLLEATRKVDKVMNKIEVGNITELNDLVYAGAVLVTGVQESRIEKAQKWNHGRK